MMDDFGRVFFQDGKIYRAIRTDRNDYCLNLLSSDLYQELLEHGYLPKTTVSDLRIENYGIVLEHEKLLSTYQHEWTFSMLKDAASLIFNINKICGKYGYELKDAHLFNVLFRGVQPVWVDIGSISPVKPASKQWRAYGEYLNAIVIPLSFLSCGKPFIGRKLLESIYYGLNTLPNQNALDSGLLSLLQLQKPVEYFILNFRRKKILKTKKKWFILSFLSKFAEKFSILFFKRPDSFFYYYKPHRQVRNITELFPSDEIEQYLRSLPRPALSSLWQGYHRNYSDEKGELQYSDRFKRILEIIQSKSDIETVIDLAGNEGLFSEFLYDNVLGLDRIITTDYDENAIDYAYNKFKAIQTNKLHALLLNFMYTPDMEGTQKRLKSDLALALAVSHHLILTANYSLGAIFEKIRSYSNRYVMIEFMPLGLWSSKSEKESIVPDWYSVEWFRAEFQSYFTILLEEKIEKNRILFFGSIN